jgi:hypothetical protein
VPVSSGQNGKDQRLKLLRRNSIGEQLKQALKAKPRITRFGVFCALADQPERLIPDL